MIGVEPVRADLLTILPETVAAAILARLPDLRMCEAKYGRLDVDEIKRMGASAPAVFVSRIGLRNDDTADSGRFFLAEMTAFIATKNTPGLDRMAAAQVISQAVILRVAEARWGLPEVGPARSVTEQVLESEATRRAQIALIAVSWLQPLALTQPELPEHPVPSELYLGGPGAGGSDPADYDLVEDAS